MLSPTWNVSKLEEVGVETLVTFRKTDDVDLVGHAQFQVLRHIPCRAQHEGGPSSVVEATEACSQDRAIAATAGGIVAQVEPVERRVADGHVCVFGEGKGAAQVFVMADHFEEQVGSGFPFERIGDPPDARFDGAVFIAEVDVSKRDGLETPKDGFAAWEPPIRDAAERLAVVAACVKAHLGLEVGTPPGEPDPIVEAFLASSLPSHLNKSGLVETKTVEPAVEGLRPFHRQVFVARDAEETVEAIDEVVVSRFVDTARGDTAGKRVGIEELSSESENAEVFGGLTVASGRLHVDQAEVPGPRSPHRVSQTL